MVWGRMGKGGPDHPFFTEDSAWKNNTEPLVTVSSGVRAKMGIFLKALQKTSLLAPFSLHSKILLAAIYRVGGVDLLRRGLVASEEPKHESEIF